MNGCRSTSFRPKQRTLPRILSAGARGLRQPSKFAVASPRLPICITLKMSLPRRRKQQGCARCLAKRSLISLHRTIRTTRRCSNMLRNLKRWQGDPLIHTAVAPHAIYTCSQKTLQDSAALARKYRARILIHVAEMKKELDDSRAQNGTTPVQYLDKLGILGPDMVAAHCIFVDQTDRRILAQRQVGCVHNPSSNMMLASGVAPVIEERAAGVAVGLGTDGPAGSNNDLDLMEEMDLAAKLQKVTKMDPQALGAKAVVEMATIEGARALHMEKEIGSLEPGKKADFISIGLDAPNAVPMYDVYAQLAYALKGSDVETVIISSSVEMHD